MSNAGRKSSPDAGLSPLLPSARLALLSSSPHLLSPCHVRIICLLSSPSARSLFSVNLLESKVFLWPGLDRRREIPSVFSLLAGMIALSVRRCRPALQMSCGSVFRLTLPLAVRAISLTKTIARGRL